MALEKTILQFKGRNVKLSEKQNKIMTALIEAPAWVFTKKMLCNVADIKSEESVVTQIKRLRRVMGKNSIRTIHGIGYQVAP